MQPQVILITGASSGFGKITAQMLSERGHIVYGTDGDYKGLPLVEGDGNTVKVGIFRFFNYISLFCKT